MSRSTLDASNNDARSFLPLSPQQFQILLALTDYPRHGYGIILDIRERTNEQMHLGTGTLYTALARLADSALIVETPAQAAGKMRGRPARGGDDPRRRYYTLTPLGRTVLGAETARLEALVKQARRRGVQPAW